LRLAQAEITEDKPPEWIVKCWKATDPEQKILITFKHYDNSVPRIYSEIRLDLLEGKTDTWTYVFPFGANLVCKMDKVLE